MKKEDAASRPKVKLSSLKANATAINDGTWIDLPELTGARMLVRSFDFAPYVVARDLLNRRLAKKYKLEISEERNAETAREYGSLYAQYILLGWDGFDVEFSRDLAEEMLPDPDWAPMKAYVEYAASRVAELNVEFVKDAGKNSGRPSVTA